MVIIINSSPYMWVSYLQFQLSATHKFPPPCSVALHHPRCTLLTPSHSRLIYPCLQPSCAVSCAACSCSARFLSDYLQSSSPLPVWLFAALQPPVQHGYETALQWNRKCHAQGRKVCLNLNNPAPAYGLGFGEPCCREMDRQATHDYVKSNTDLIMLRVSFISSNQIRPLVDRSQ